MLGYNFGRFSIAVNYQRGINGITIEEPDLIMNDVGIKLICQLI